MNDGNDSSVWRDDELVPCQAPCHTAVMASPLRKSSRSPSSSTKRTGDFGGDVTLAAPTIGDGSPAGTVDWITRGEVAELMHVSVATVRRLQASELHPRRSPEGVYLFDPREVEEARARRPPPPERVVCCEPGELAAEAFKLFRDGVDVRDAVIALRRPPAEVEALSADWERLGDMLFVSQRVRWQLDRMARTGLLSEEIVEAIDADDADTLRDLVSDATGEPT